MEEHISAMMDARKRYRDAFTTLVKEYNSAGNQPIMGTDVAVELAKENLKEEHKRLVSTNKNTKAFLDKKIQRVNELQAEIQANAMDPNAPEPDYAQVKERLMQLIKDKEDVESEAQYGGVADVSEEHDTTMSQALPDLDLSKPELEEAVEHHTAKPPSERLKSKQAIRGPVSKKYQEHEFCCVIRTVQGMTVHEAVKFLEDHPFDQAAGKLGSESSDESEHDHIEEDEALKKF